MLMCISTGLMLLGAQRHKLTFPKLTLPSVFTSTRSQPIASPIPTSDSKLVVDLSDRKVYFYKNEILKKSYPVAIGQEGWETPTGSFKVFQKYENPVWQHPITGEVIPPGDRNPLGKWWLGFHNHSNLLIGFHGTPHESLLGEAVSHGCLRMRNADIETLAQHIELGTLVIVRP
ncbi:L,D-transpeptidase family protein [Myxacorys almedinensis A]|uniref:L,D-transpeptidase family protein n=2 Tax=Myxacorys TaxID=2056239 RepID=A0A8J8CHI6_9CYAN|nr:L,D-transpeptidase family protein [Myxacorys almedinensis A]